MVKTWGGNQFWGFIDPQILLDYENSKEFMLLEIQAGMMTDKYFGTKGQTDPTIGRWKWDTRSSGKPRGRVGRKSGLARSDGALRSKAG